MTERFDDLTRVMAAPHTRRSVLKAVGVAAAGATAATIFKPFRGQASVGCPAGAPTCGSGCCQKGETCSNPATGCCCPSGTTPCGQTCCAKGIACVDSGRGVCGCPPRMTPCGSAGNLTCCATGKACGDASCQPVANFSSNVAKKCNPCSAGTVLFFDDFNSDAQGAYCGVAPAGWSLNPSTGNVDVFDPLDGASNGNVVDLDGSPNLCGGNDGVPAMSLATPITIVAGKTYTACFRIGTNPSPFNPTQPDVNSATVNFGPVSNTYTKQASEKGSYTTESLSFVAGANGTAQLTFQEVGPSDRGGVTLDTVTITEQ